MVPRAEIKGGEGNSRNGWETEPKLEIGLIRIKSRLKLEKKNDLPLHHRGSNGRYPLKSQRKGKDTPLLKTHPPLHK